MSPVYYLAEVHPWEQYNSTRNTFLCPAQNSSPFCFWTLIRVRLNWNLCDCLMETECSVGRIIWNVKICELVAHFWIDVDCFLVSSFLFVFHVFCNYEIRSELFSWVYRKQVFCVQNSKRVFKYFLILLKIFKCSPWNIYVFLFTLFMANSSHCVISWVPHFTLCISVTL